jgi:hypothetical protein
MEGLQNIDGKKKKVGYERGFLFSSESSCVEYISYTNAII